MRRFFWTRVGGSALALAAAPAAAMAQEAGQSAPFGWDVVGLSALFGAIGGLVYELMALQGNVEWPHRTRTEEVAEGGYPYAKAAFLFDLGILARLIIGAAAALVVYWAIPVEEGIRLIAVALIAGSAGTAIFRSLQDRLLVAMTKERIDGVAQGLEELNGEIVRKRADMPARGLGERAGTESPELAEIQGRVAALLKVAKRGQ